jgi:BirA family biotin operon repressor/biotin-[acetyl-CoA-carboxylase] ligase
LFNKNYIYFDVLDSTNEFALSLKGMPLFTEGLIISTKYQSKGKGQIGKQWHSEKDLNILLSIVIEPKISFKKQFDISKLISLSCYDLLISLGLSPKIKWPNDILINKKKIAGILIQNVITNNIISHSVIGVGVNINQHNFPQFSPLATSLSLELNKQQDCVDIRDKLLKSLSNRLIAYRKGDKLDPAYQDALFLKDKIANLQKGQKQFKGIIKRVNSNGLLQVEVNKKLKEFTRKEVKFIF